MFSTYILLATPRFEQRFERTTAIRPLGIRIKDHLQAAAINVASVLANQRLSTVPPWRLKTPLVDFSLAKHTKKCTSPDTFNALYREHS